MRDRIELGLAILLALAFLGAGGSKLAGVEQHVTNFDKWGYPLWFMYVTGLIEVGGAAMLPFKRTRFFGAALLVATMTGAILTHIVAGEIGGPMVPPIVLLSLSGYLVWRERARLNDLLGSNSATPTAA